MSAPRMRTIREAVAELKQLDPHTAVTHHMIRRLVLAGDIPHICVGAKRLLNLDALLAYLSTPQQSRSDAPESGQIRAIPERRCSP